jgi:hypothetical protein
MYENRHPIDSAKKVGMPADWILENAKVSMIKRQVVDPANSAYRLIM